MIKQYIFALMLSAFVISCNISHGITANAETSITQTTEINQSAITTVSSSTGQDNKPEFVQNTLPQTGVEANHSGLYFSIAGFFLLLAVFTSRSKSTKNLNVSENKKSKH